MGLVAVVDEHNRFLRWEDRAVVHAQRLPHRSVHVMVFSTDGQRMLIQQRHPQKLTFPSWWDNACSGHVEADDYFPQQDPDDRLDEIYALTARRELAEELGLIAPPDDPSPDNSSPNSAALRFLAEFAPDPSIHYEHTRLYAFTHDGPFTLQAEEVSAVAWVTPDELDAWDASPDTLVTPLLMFFRRWLAAHQIWPTDSK